MSSTKRQRSLDGSEGGAAPSKTRKLSQVETQKQGHGIQITVKLRSTSKAAKNAPKTAEYYRQRAKLLGYMDSDAADELETST